MSVHTHVLSPHGQGLYQGAIAQSGTADMYLLEDRGDREEQFARDLALALNCSNVNYTREMLECLQEADIGNDDDEETALDNINFVLGSVMTSVTGAQWWIVIDNYAEDPFLPETPLRMMRSGKMKNIPYISGTMASEGGLTVSSIYNSITDTGDGWDTTGPFLSGLTINQDPALFTEEDLSLARLIKDVYTGGNFTRYTGS